MHIRARTPTSTAATAATAATTVADPAVTAPVAPATAVSSQPDSERAHGHHAHGGHGHLRQALNQALQDLGLTSAQGQGGSGDRDGAGTSGNVKHDMAQFMHSLFQAVKGESASASANTATSSADPKGGFAAGLTALMAQAAGGTAPQALQDAFDKLAADFPPAAAAGTPPVPPPSADTPATPTDPVTPASLPTAAPANAPVAAATSESSAATAPALTLQTLLSKLQQDLGHYGKRSAWATPATGNAVNLTA
jgi:hypothetical protein